MNNSDFIYCGGGLPKDECKRFFYVLYKITGNTYVSEIFGKTRGVTKITSPLKKIL